MKIFICALALWTAFEGLCFVLAPEFMKETLKEIASQDAGALRSVGVIALIAAILLAFLGRQIS